MNSNAFNFREISRLVIASAIAAALGMNAPAQTTPALRTPRRLFNGKIDIRNANIPHVDAAATSNPNTAQGPGGAARGGGPGCDVFPAPASVGTTVDLSYFGPPPSTVNQSLVGPVQLLNTGQVDSIHGTITIPLYLGHMIDGKNVWYILTGSMTPTWQPNSD